MRAITCALVTVALAAAPTPARASVEPAATPTTNDDALAKAKAFHVEADAKYNTADYEGAIKSWQQAFGALPRTSEANSYRSLILYNIAAAREKLFALRGDVEHLKQARILLQQFEASIDETFAGAPEEGRKERAQVEEKLARIDEMIAEAERDDPPAKPPVVAPPVATRPEPTTDAPPTERNPGRGLIIGGGVLLGLGVAAVAGMAGAMVVGKKANDLSDIDDDDLAARENQFDRGRGANAGAIAAGTIGTLCVAAGIALLVVGAKRKSSRTAASPIIGRGMAGVGLSGRF